MHRNCPVGDLASKHGNVTVSLASARQSTTKAAFTDSNLPLSGANSVIGKSIVLFPVNDPLKPIACAKIEILMSRVTKATFTPDANEGVSGYFEFTQASPFDPTMAKIHLNGLQSKAHGYHVHAYPSPDHKKLSGRDACHGFIAGDHWNPFDIDINTSPAEGTGGVCHNLLHVFVKGAKETNACATVTNERNNIFTYLLKLSSLSWL